MIYLAPPNRQWPELFLAECGLLREIIGARILQIEHIGSTAIPRVYAKPVIDIMVGVENLAVVDAQFINNLESVGYEYMQKYEDKMPLRRFFLKNNQDGVRTHHIHLVELDSDFWRKHLLFRDYLRAHPEEAKKYEVVKLELAKQFTDTNDYARAKNEICDEIHEKAIKWKS